MERIKKILYDMRSSLKSEMRTKWMNEDEVRSNNELQSEITEVILIIEREQKQSEPQSNCNLPHVSKSESIERRASLIAFIQEKIKNRDMNLYMNASELVDQMLKRNL